MFRLHRLRFFLPFLSLLMISGGAQWRLIGSQSEPAVGQWVTTWSGAVQQFRESPANGGAMPAPQFRDAWDHGILNNQTIRIVVGSTMSGSRVRIRLSNAFGTQPLTIGAAHIVAVPSDTMRIAGGRGMVSPNGFGNTPFDGLTMAVPEQNTEISGTGRSILFGGQAAVVVAPGGTVVSDPLDFETREPGFMAVSLYLPNKTQPATYIGSAITASVREGDATAVGPATQGRPAGPARGSLWLSGVDVFGSAESKGILIIDDDSRWRDGSDIGAGWQLSFMDRVLSNGGSKRNAVLDSSIAGSSLIANSHPNALERIQDAVRNKSGVKWVILTSGFEDILAASYDSGIKGQAPLNTKVEDLIATLSKIAAEAHTAGLRIIGATYPPFEGNLMYTEKGETMREAANTWIRTSGAFDAVADFDSAVRDPQNPKRRQLQFAGDARALLSRAAFKALAESIDTSVFAR